MEVDITYGSITVRLGGVASYCDHGDGATVQPDNPAGVTLISITYAVAGTGYQTTNPTGQIRTDIGGDPRILSTVAPGTVIPATHSLVCLFTRATRPPGWISGRSSYIDEALPIVVVAYGPLNTSMAPVLMRPPAIGHPSNPAIAALRSTQLVFDNATIGTLPAVIDIDALPIQPSPGWGGFFNERPNIDDYIAQFAGFCGELWTGWATEGYTPFLQHKGYGGFFSAWVSYALLMIVSTDDAAKRRQLAQRLTQWGVDLLGSYIHGRQDYVDGGHMQGRLALVVLSGHLLEAPWKDATAFLASIGSAAEFNENLQFFTRSSPPAWVWGWPHGYIGKSGLVGEFRVNIDEPINTWSERTGYYLSQYFKQEVCGTQIGCAVAMRILGLSDEMGVGHRGMMEQWMEGPSPSDQAAMAAHDARLADIDWGSGYAADTGTYDFGRAAWEVYGDYEPPATVVNVPVGPGSSAYQSTRYTATIDGEPAYVYGHARACGRPTAMWNFGDVVEQSWLKFTSNGTTTVRIAKVSGSITSAAVFPGGVATQSIVGGVLELTVPTRTYLRVVVDGDRANAMAVWSNPLPAAVGDATDWTTLAKAVASLDTETNTLTMATAHGWSAGQRVVMATTGTLPAVDGAALSVHEALWVVSPSGANLQLARTAGGTPINFTSAGTGSLSLTRGDWTSGTLYFPPGVHTISRMFKLSSGVRLYFHLDAAVIGSLDYRGADPVLTEGPGHLLGLFATPEFVNSAPLTYLQRLEYTMLLGYDGSKFAFDNEMRDLTIAICPWGTEFVCGNRWLDVSVMSPWYYNNGIAPIRRNSTDHSSLIEHCFIYTGDDTFTIGEQTTAFNITIRNCVAITVANSNVHLSYWPGQDLGYSTLVENCDFMHLGIADRGPGTDDSAYCPWGGNAIFKAHVDGAIGEEAFGRFRVHAKNCRVWDTVLSRVFHIGNRDYTWDWPSQSASRARRGQIQGFTFENIWIEQVPGQTSDIFGLDANNKPQDIAWVGLQIGGVAVTAANCRTYFTIDQWARNITFDGVRVDMIQTTGAAAVAVGASGTSGLQIVSVGGASVSISAAGASALQIGTVGAVTIPIGASGFSTLGVVIPPVVELPTNVPRGPAVRPWTRRRRPWWTWLNPWG